MSQLDRYQLYQFQDKFEVVWQFHYMVIGEEEGWFVTMIHPGSKPMCIGRLPEKEVIEKLAENVPLTKDDLIDLELWMKYHFGVDEFKPKEKKPRKPRVKKET